MNKHIKNTYTALLSYKLRLDKDELIKTALHYQYWLDELEQAHPMYSTILAYYKTYKLLSTYVC